jgi:hypothetical protein
MKRLLIILFSVIALVGCQATNSDLIKSEHYKTLYSELLNQLDVNSSSPYFSVSATLNPLSGARYRYDVFIDEPQIAMYDIEILVIVDNGSLVIQDIMMPSVGIFDDKEYHMLPYQVHPENGFVKGFGLNGITDASSVKLKIVVSWKDVNRLRTYKTFLGLEVQTP